MKWLILCGLITFGLGLLSGCKAKYKDISADPAYHHLLNKRYEILSSLNVYGVNSYGNSNNEMIDDYSVINYGYASHAVLTRGNLNKGTKFEILKIRSCTNCLFQKLIEYQISVVSESPLKNVTQPVYLSDVKNNMVVEDGEGRIGLDSTVFKLLN